AANWWRDDSDKEGEDGGNKNREDGVRRRDGVFRLTVANFLKWKQQGEEVRPVVVPRCRHWGKEERIEGCDVRLERWCFRRGSSGFG
ncbi:hypothetical protein HAX54_005455, partial [Datura stramonium]|nr:hypothetical protein [Datura stramonium]